ncbi:hypothetical protein ACSBR2_012627 [Camellia fascicularis]
MEVFSPEDAWTLFRDQVGGVIVDSSNIQPIAQATVNECGGLPLNLIVIGRALRNQNNAIVWKLTLHDFQSLSVLKTHDSEALIRQLKFSYDHLKGHATKCCLLYTALYQEGYETRVFELVKHWIEEGLITGHLIDANEKALGIVKDHVDAFLSESSDDGVLSRCIE